MGGRRRSQLRLLFKAEYDALKNAIHRCYNEANLAYKSYGARGVTVCDEWRSNGGFARFLDHLGPRPSPLHSLDRIDNLNGHYAPGQVRWTDRQTQQNNRRPHKPRVKDLGWGIGYTQAEARPGKGRKASPLLPHQGRVQTLIEWSRELNLRGSTIRQRLLRGASVDEALNPSTSRVGMKRRVEKNAFILPAKH